MTEMSDRQVHSALVKWVEGITSVNVIKADQGGDAPSLPYVMIRLTGTAAVRDWPMDEDFEEVDESDPDLGIIARPIIETEWRFSVHVFGSPMPTDVLRPIRSAAHLNQAAEPLYPELMIHEVSQIRNVPEVINEGIEPRAQMDIFLRGVTRDGHVINPIETVPPIDIQRMP